MSKKIFLVLSIVILFSMIGCSSKSTDEKKLHKAEQEEEITELLENRYRYLNDHDVEKHLSLWIKGEKITEENKKMLKDQLENIDYAKLIDIKRNLESEKFYMTQENYKKITQGNLRVYHTTYEIRFKDEKLGLVPNGKNSTIFIIVKENDNSPWRISSTEGQGY